MQGIKRAGSAALGLALAFSLFGGVHAALAAPPAPSSPPAPTTVYDAIPSLLPPSMVSQAFQATSTSEFGDSVQLAGTNRVLNTVTVTMVTWAPFSDYSSYPQYSVNPVSWSHPITVNVYSNSLDGNGVPDQLLTTKTANISIPWRPAADSSCATPTKWRAGDGQCYNGFAFNAVFDLSSSSVTLPDDVILGIAFNTQSYGTPPIGTPGPYNSLNVGVVNGATIGTDANVDNVFLNASLPDAYTDNGTAGVGIFRQDSGWTPYGTVAMKITASPALVAPPTSKDQCKQSGWMTFNNPSFKNQGDCVSFIATGGKNTANG